MRRAIPPNGKIHKDAKEAVQELVSEFIAFITSEASDKCKREKRETMTGDDLLWAMATLGFENYIEPLKLYLQKYREWCRRERMADAPASPVAAGGSHDGGSPSAGGARKRDRFLSVADISRIMRRAIPPNGKIHKDAKEGVQELVSEFIAFITSEASDKCKRAGDHDR
uniref:Uncharacterized protein n=1 Tax=Avena sativa TaxID=4498 RepID=A0ACD5ZQT6_AVESA